MDLSYNFNKLGQKVVPDEKFGILRKSSKSINENETKCHDVANESFVCSESRLDETKESFGKLIYLPTKCSESRLDETKESFWKLTYLHTNHGVYKPRV